MYPRATFRFFPRVHLEPLAAVASKTHVCFDCSSTHPFAENATPPITMALFLATATPIAGRLTHADGVVPGQASLLKSFVLLVAGKNACTAVTMLPPLSSVRPPKM